MKSSSKGGQEIKALCSNIRSLRIKRQITLEDLSLYTGIKEGDLLQLESGILPEDFGVDEFFKLCNYFFVKPYSMFLSPEKIIPKNDKKAPR